jgi:hypothetical protein
MCVCVCENGCDACVCVSVCVRENGCDACVCENGCDACVCVCVCVCVYVCARVRVFKWMRQFVSMKIPVFVSLSAWFLVRR